MPKARKVGAILAEAKSKLAEGDLGDALDSLLEAWRQVPAASLAAAIETVGAQAVLAADRKSPTGKTPKERNAAWDVAAKAGDATMRGVLLASLMETKGSAETLARLELLLAGPSDPRVAAKIGDMIEIPPYNASVSRTNAFWKRLFGLVPELGDPRLLVRARTWERVWKINTELNEPEREALTKRLAKAMPLLEKAYRDDRRLDAADEALVAALVPSKATTRRATETAKTEADFLAAILADPSDDALRLVYADFLTERSDPRGEFINLQITRGEGKRPSAREKELLAEFQTRWLGSLATKVVKKGARFERGFLVACTLREAGLDEDPAWATLEEIDGGLPPSDACAMPRLRVATNVRPRDLHRLAKRKTPLPIESLVYAHHDDWPFDGDEEAAFDAFARLPAKVLPALRHLEITAGRAGGAPPSAMAWAWSAPSTRHLASLTMPAAIAKLKAWHAALAPTTIPRIILWGQRTLENYFQSSKDAAWHMVFTRDDQGALSRLELLAGAPLRTPPRDPPVAEEPLAGLATLPADALSSVRIVAPKALEAGFEKALKRQKRLANLTFEEHGR